MNKIRLYLCAALACTAIAGGQTQPGEPPEFQKREFVDSAGEALQYVVYVPPELAVEKAVPLLIFLHGSCGVCVTHERILKESNLQFWHGYERNVQREPTILMARVGGRGGWTGASRQRVVFSIIDGLLEEFPIDRRRIYLQGFSMGGGGAWRYLQERPGFFAAANPQALSARDLDAEKVKETPIWATIGSDDSRADAMTANVAAIRAANGDPRGGLPQVTGVNPRFAIFPDTNHGGAQGATQKLPGFMDWMYSQVNDGNVAPNVRFLQPEIDAQSASGTVTARVAAHDVEGGLARVEFYNGEAKIAEVTEEPFEYRYENLAPGPQLLKARAVDAHGKSRTAELLIQIE